MNDTHSFYLNSLIKHLDRVHINPFGIVTILREPVWMPINSTRLLSLCDLIVINYDMTAIPIELKSTMNSELKALKQLKQGCTYIDEIYNGLYTVNYGKVIYYRSGKSHFVDYPRRTLDELL